MPDRRKRRWRKGSLHEKRWARLRLPYGTCNPFRTEHVALLLVEVDRRMASSLFDQKLDPAKEKRGA